MRPQRITRIAPRDVPPGAVGMCVTQGAIGRIIAHRQGGIPYSHVVIGTGRGQMLHAIFPRARHEPIDYRWPDREIDWFAPRKPLSADRVNDLRSAAHMLHDRAWYSIRALVEFVVHGYPRKRGWGVYCSQLVGELWLLFGYDFTGIRKPWQCDPRAILARVNAPHGPWIYIGTTGGDQ